MFIVKWTFQIMAHVDVLLRHIFSWFTRIPWFGTI